MRRTALAVGLWLSACAGDDPSSCPEPPAVRCAAATSSADLAVVSVLRIETPVADALVLTHRVDGTIIARGHTDAEGCAQLASEPGALLTVSSDAGQQRALLTTTAPPADRRTVRLPADEASTCTAGRLRIDVLNPRTAEGPGELTYRVSAGCNLHGCVEASAGRPSVFLDVPDHAVGEDGLVHLWIRECYGYDSACRDAVASAGLDGSVPVNLGEPLGDFESNGFGVELDGQRFPAWVTDTALATIAGLPFDHVIQNSVVSSTDFHRSMTRRWAADDPRPPPPAPDEFLPELDGGAWLDDNRALRLPAPAFAADSVLAELALGSTTWNVLLPPGLTPITLPADPDLPGLFAQGWSARILDEDVHPDHESLVAGGIDYHPLAGLTTPLQIPVTSRLRTTVSRLPGDF